MLLFSTPRGSLGFDIKVPQKAECHKTLLLHTCILRTGLNGVDVIYSLYFWISSHHINWLIIGVLAAPGDSYRHSKAGTIEAPQPTWHVGYKWGRGVGQKWGQNSKAFQTEQRRGDMAKVLIPYSKICALYNLAFFPVQLFWGSILICPVMHIKVADQSEPFQFSVCQ